MAETSPTPTMEELLGLIATHQFDSYVFVCVEILPCRERHKNAMKSNPCITPTAHPLLSLRAPGLKNILNRFCRSHNT